MKTPVIYYGGKTALARTIARYAPASRSLYLETFFGSGAVFFYRHSWARTEIINDLNGDVVNFFRVLRDKPKKLIEALQITPAARQEVRDSTRFIKTSKNEITRALYFFVRANQSFSGNMRANGGWHVSIDKDTAGEWSNRTAADFLYAAAERLKRASIENNPAIYVLKMFDSPEAFVYHDPPYLSVASEKDKRAAYQGHDMKEADHEKFIEACLEAKAMQIISGYDHPLYDVLVENGWRKVVIPHHTSAGNKKEMKFKNDFDSSRDEILWISPNIQIPLYEQKTLF